MARKFKVSAQISAEDKAWVQVFPDGRVVYA